MADRADVENSSSPRSSEGLSLNVLLCAASSTDLRKTDFEAFDREAIALVLMKQGRGDYARAHLPEMRPAAKAWYDILLSSKGWNVIGPNNCALGYPYHPTVVMQPLLKSWSDNSWHLP
ncbi:MAG TPA: hypothetical protein VJL82_00280 [Rhizomicrobium sp.]|nr:hypothetical protein [Rhizomicrobium sp.]